MEWFRLYDEIVDDPKVQKLSPALFKHWINILCLANRNKPRGVLPNIETIAFRLRITEPKAEEILEALYAAGLIDDLKDGTSVPHNWQLRQYGKPSATPERVAERVRKSRAKTSNADVTPPKHDETPRAGDKTDTDTDTDTDTEEKQRRGEKTPPQPPKGRRAVAESPEFVAFYDAYPRHQARDDAWRAWLKLSPGDVLVAEIMAGLNALLPEYRARPPDKVPLPATFLNGGRWKDAPIPIHQNGIDPDEAIRLWKLGAAAEPPTPIRQAAR